MAARTVRLLNHQLQQQQQDQENGNTRVAGKLGESLLGGSLGVGTTPAHTSSIPRAPLRPSSGSWANADSEKTQLLATSGGGQVRVGRMEGGEGSMSKIPLPPSRYGSRSGSAGRGPSTLPTAPLPPLPVVVQQQQQQQQHQQQPPHLDELAVLSTPAAATVAQGGLAVEEEVAVKPWKTSLNLLKKKGASGVGAALPAPVVAPTPSSSSGISSGGGSGSVNEHTSFPALSPSTGTLSYPGSFFPVDSMSSSSSSRVIPPSASITPREQGEEEVPLPLDSGRAEVDVSALSSTTTTTITSPSGSGSWGEGRSFRALPPPAYPLEDKRGGIVPVAPAPPALAAVSAIVPPQPAPLEAVVVASAKKVVATTASSAAVAPSSIARRPRPPPAFTSPEDFLLLAARFAPLSPQDSYFASRASECVAAGSGGVMGAGTLFSPNLTSSFSSSSSPHPPYPKATEGHPAAGTVAAEAQGEVNTSTTAFPVKDLFGAGGRGGGGGGEEGVSIGDTSLFAAAKALEAEEAEAEAASAAAGVEMSGMERAGVFTIPTLPTGSVLTIQPLSNWGDGEFVGVSRVECFSGEGGCDRVEFLEGGGSGEGISEPWLRPCASIGRGEELTLTFSRPTSLALLRIWNISSGNRVHSYRGVKEARVLLDGVVIFEGDVRRANGRYQGLDSSGSGSGSKSLGEEEEEEEEGITPPPSVLSCAETVLFTQDLGVLGRVEANDPHAEAVARWQRRNAAVDSSMALGVGVGVGVELIATNDLSEVERLIAATDLSGENLGATGLLDVEALVREFELEDMKQGQQVGGGGGKALSDSSPPSIIATTSTAAVATAAVLPPLPFHPIPSSHAPSVTPSNPGRLGEVLPLHTLPMGRRLHLSLLENWEGGECTVPPESVEVLVATPTTAMASGEEGGGGGGEGGAFGKVEVWRGGEGGGGHFHRGIQWYQSSSALSACIDLGSRVCVAGVRVVSSSGGGGGGGEGEGYSGLAPRYLSLSIDGVSVEGHCSGGGGVLTLRCPSIPYTFSSSSSSTTSTSYPPTPPQYIDLCAVKKGVFSQLWTPLALPGKPSSSKHRGGGGGGGYIAPPPWIPNSSPPPPPHILRAFLAQDFEPCHAFGPPTVTSLCITLCAVAPPPPSNNSNASSSSSSSSSLILPSLSTLAVYDYKGVRVPVAPWQARILPPKERSATPPTPTPYAGAVFIAPMGGGGGSSTTSSSASKEAEARRDDPALYIPTATPPSHGAVSVPYTGLSMEVLFDAPLSLGLLRFFFNDATPATLDVTVCSDGGWAIGGGRVKCGGRLTHPYASVGFFPSEECLGSDVAAGALLGASTVRGNATLLFNNGKQVPK